MDLVLLIQLSYPQQYCLPTSLKVKEEKKQARAVTFQGQGIMRVGFRQEALERKKIS
jgi:hypothetical protein